MNEEKKKQPNNYIPYHLDKKAYNTNKLLEAGDRFKQCPHNVCIFRECILYACTCNVNTKNKNRKSENGMEIECEAAVTKMKRKCAF